MRKYGLGCKILKLSFNNAKRVCHSSYDGNLGMSSVIFLLWGPSSACVGFVILASPCLGADSSHPCTLLGEVSSQSRIVDLLHVLLDFSFGVLQQVSLTLRERENRGNQEGSEATQGSKERRVRRVDVEGSEGER